jgi:hypothetical protein
LKVNRRFGEIYRLQIQGHRISKARNQREVGSKHVGFLLGLFFDPKDGNEMFLQNVG